MSCRSYHVLYCEGPNCKRQHSVEISPYQPCTINEARNHAWNSGWNRINCRDYCPSCSQYLPAPNWPVTQIDAKESQG